MHNRLSELLDEAIQFVSDAKIGLPQELFYFVSRLTPLINVDLLIKNKNGQTLLTWRDDQFYGPGWHIPGGIIRFKESIHDRIEKVAATELGCRVNFAPEPIHARSLMNKDREIRGHFISLLYLCELNSKPDPKIYCTSLSSPIGGQWAWHDRAPPNLIKPHEFFRAFIDATPPM